MRSIKLKLFVLLVLMTSCGVDELSSEVEGQRLVTENEDMNSDILAYNPTQQTVAIEAQPLNNTSYAVIQGGYDSCGEGGDPKKSDIYLAMAGTLKAQADKPTQHSSSCFTKILKR